MNFELRLNTVKKPINMISSDKSREKNQFNSKLNQKYTQEVLKECIIYTCFIKFNKKIIGFLYTL